MAAPILRATALLLAIAVLAEASGRMLRMTPNEQIAETRLFKNITFVTSGHRIFEELMKGYNQSDRPNSGVGPVDVSLSLAIMSFSDFREADQDFQIRVIIRQSWVDPRLKTDLFDANSDTVLHLNTDQMMKLWRPEIFISNARSYTRDKEYGTAYLKSDGTLMYSVLSDVTVGCKMNFKDYPIDQQKCEIQLESYSYPMYDVRYSWWNTAIPVTIVQNNLAEFEVKGVTPNLPFTVEYGTGVYSSINVSFIFHRRLGYYLIQMYIPSMLVTWASWVVFWMDRKSVAERSALAITCILTMVFLLGTSNSTVPRVSYIKAIDWFIITSLIFIFLATLECMIVYRMDTFRTIKMEKREKKKNELEKAKQEKNDNIEYIPKSDPRRKSEYATVMQIDAAIRKSIKEPFNPGLWVDRLSRLLFPLAYVGFNFVYWILYIGEMGKFLEEWQNTACASPSGGSVRR